MSGLDEFTLSSSAAGGAHEAAGGGTAATGSGTAAVGGASGGEDCGNDQDDDDDGTIDCADPDCGASMCIDAAPDGWLGPFALYDGDPAALPACGPPFSEPTLVDMFAGLDRAAAQCSPCTCSSPTDLTCVPEDIWVYADENCAGPIGAILSMTSGSDVCQSTPSFIDSIMFRGWRVEGTCAAGSPQVPVLGDVTWARAALGCAPLLAGHGGCGGDEVCAPLPEPPFEPATLCVAHPGIVDCPSSTYGARRVFYEGADDTRGCTACECAFDAGSCSGTLHGYSGASCNTPLWSKPSSAPDCGNTSAGSLKYTSASNPQCSPEGGDALGCLAPKQATTICCNAGGTTCPADMVEVPLPGGDSYCIDATEVTKQQYGSFLASNPAPAGQPAHCSWNDTFVPSGSWPGDADLPVTYVDWCDALAYCTWAGKRLCGQIGGGSNPTADANDPAKSQWYAACSAGGQHAYPYGDTYLPDVCPDDGLATAVGSDPCCMGGYEGLYDMVGVTWEWEDSCSGTLGSTDECLTRGRNDCEYKDAVLRNTANSRTGIRCCSL